MKTWTKFALWTIGLALLALAVWLPTQWYDTLPKPEGDIAEPPFKGVTLLRLCLGIEGVALLLAATWPIPLAVARRNRLSLPAPVEPSGSECRSARIWLLAIAVLAAVLRLYRLDADLWLDEIATVLNFEHVSLLHIVTAYTHSNNHFLNTIAIKWMLWLAGREEWAIRLPAAVQGIAGVIATYFLARFALRRREAQGVALLIAVSYHHIFFSQNARGYSGMLLWSTVATIFWLRALATDERRDWLLYIIAMFVNIATILHGLLVVAGHVFAFVGVCIALRRQQKPLVPLLRKALAMWSILAALVVNFYACVIPQAYVYIASVYKSEAAGFRLFSREHVQQWLQAFSDAFSGTGEIVLVVGLLVGVVCWGYFARRNVVYSLTLLSPLVVTLLVIVLGNLQFSPRMLLWMLPIAFIFAVGTIATLAEKMRQFWPSLPQGAITAVPLFVVVCIAFASLLSLPHYYRTAKQPTRVSLQWLLQAKSEDDIVVACYLSEWGLRFYGPAQNFHEGEHYHSVRSLQRLEQLEREHPKRQIWLMTTFPRALSIEFPDLYRHIQDHYQLGKTFPATIGGGEISIWKRYAPTPK